MYKKLSNVKLKSGEDMDIGVVTAPDQDFADRMMDVLNHKGDPWLIHVERALKGDIKELETRFYIGHLDGHVIANIMTVEYNRTGILGHVFTRPEHRRKGACSLVMDYQMDDFRKHGGGVLLLGTGYDSPAYWIYHAHGFRSMSEGSGFMRYATDSDFEEEHFTSGNVEVVDVAWKHWPVLNVLTSVPGIEIMRSLSMGLYGIANFEGGFLRFMKSLENDDRKKAKLMESEYGAVVGCITLNPDERWHGEVYMLDMFLHDNFISGYDKLVESIDMPDGKIQCYVDATSPDEKIKALEKTGFKQEAVMKNQFMWNDKPFDVLLYSKFK
ncbi:GNAT family N-acetyltransferase [Candidatus Poribacteria bacterium]|nr:GNAT family N-acetyltransferase [Candidatus Poribacteria bacterium]